MKSLTPQQARQRTVPGFLSRAYTRMKARIKGTDGARNRANDYWRGLDICDRSEFIDWAEACPEFKKLFKNWLKNECPQKLRPVVDRIDPLKGYVLGNIQWLTLSDNSKKARRTLGGRVMGEVSNED